MTDSAATSQSRTGAAAPVFGFVLFGGPLSGALVRDVRLANELAQRGYDVHVWWAVERSDVVTLDERITEHWLFHGARYMPMPLIWRWTRGVQEAAGFMSVRLFRYKNRMRAMQDRPKILEALMRQMMRVICDGVERDPAVAARFARGLESARVTHVLPMLGMLAPWVDAARQRMSAPPKSLITFQGYELYANYARDIKLESQLYQRLRDAADASDFPAIAVSTDYRRRVTEDIGVDAQKLTAIPPGVPMPEPMPRDTAKARIHELLPNHKAGLPLICYVGRQDTEKGLDLLLYAAAILRRQGHNFQLAICGPTLFGSYYGRILRQIAENLRCPLIRRQYISEELRQALFAGSEVVVYPSIHREPFGMVAAEAMAHGTPVVVPAYGGVSDVVEANGACGGLRFNVWDSGDLAEKLDQLLTDTGLWDKLAAEAPRAAEYFSVPNLADRVLAHMGLAPPQEAAKPPDAQPEPAPSAR